MVVHIVKSTRAPGPGPKAYPGTQAVVRALRLLKAFGSGAAERGLAELSRDQGLNKTTTYRLLTALESEGLVQRGASREAWRLGPELIALGSRAGGAVDLRSAARAELEALARDTRETASLEVLVGRDTLIVDEVQGGYMIGTAPAAGTRWPAHATSTGKVILAFTDEATLEAFLAAPLARCTPRTLVGAAALRRDLQRVRARGYAVTTEELEAGYVAVGAPVRDAAGQVVAAVSVGGPRARLGAAAVAELGRRLPQAAAVLSHRLGYRSPERLPRASSRKKAQS
ncbi:MAG: IclR family transcriptional regulator [Vicinamibacteria bacterium]|nr:IclR family transcriptional regulator [Vicinamibacteria bacterium]